MNVIMNTGKHLKKLDSGKMNIPNIIHTALMGNTRVSLKNKYLIFLLIFFSFIISSVSAVDTLSPPIKIIPITEPLVMDENKVLTKINTAIKSNSRQQNPLDTDVTNRINQKEKTSNNIIFTNNSSINEKPPAFLKVEPSEGIPPFTCTATIEGDNGYYTDFRWCSYVDTGFVAGCGNATVKNRIMTFNIPRLCDNPYFSHKITVVCMNFSGPFYGPELEKKIKTNHRNCFISHLYPMDSNNDADTEFTLYGGGFVENFKYFISLEEVNGLNTVKGEIIRINSSKEISGVFHTKNAKEGNYRIIFLDDHCPKHIRNSGFFSIKNASLEGPMIEKIKPSTSISNIKLNCEIVGSNFKSVPSVIFFNKGISIPMQVKTFSPTSINGTVDLKNAPIGFYNIYVANPDGKHDLKNNIFQVINNSSPQIISIIPDMSSNYAPVNVKITGQGFQSGALISLVKSEKMKIFSNKIDDRITPREIYTIFNITGAELGNYSIFVNNPDGSSATLPNSFTIFSKSQISKITPNIAPNTSPIEVTIEGNGFIQGSFVSLVNKSRSIYSEKGKDLITSTKIIATFNLTNVDAGIYSLSIINPVDGQEAVLKDAFTVTSVKIPVVLIHGWNGKSADWIELQKKFESNGIPVWNYDYKNNNKDDPKIIALDFYNYILEKRKSSNPPYEGPIDIYCHSMGALVSRYYMEYFQGAPKVRQWIGVAPVVHGAAFADNSVSSNLWYGVYLFFTQIITGKFDVAARQLSTNSETVIDLEKSIQRGLPANIKYRVIAGYNPWYSPEFFSPLMGMTLEKNGPLYGWTYIGDMIVAFKQSHIIGKDYDLVPLNPTKFNGVHSSYNHMNLPHNSEVINLIWKYYNNPNIPSTNNNVPLSPVFNVNMKPTLYPFSNVVKEHIQKIKVVKAVTVVIDIIDPILPHSGDNNNLNTNLLDLVTIIVTDEYGNSFSPNSSNSDYYEENPNRLGFSIKKRNSENYIIKIIPINSNSEGYSGNISIFEFSNTPTDQTGSLKISSTPSGAGIKLDGGITKSITPYTITGVSVGTHSLLLNKTGYKDWSQNVVIKTGQTTSVSARLILNGQPGSLYIISNPQGASIYLDEVNTGYVTPKTITGVSPGTHTLLLNKTGYNDYSKPVIIKSGLKTSVSATLKPNGKTGSIFVISNPQGASIYLDGIKTGYVTPKTITGISVGTHTLLLNKTGYNDYSKPVIINSGLKTSISTRLIPIKKSGSLYILSNPVGASIQLNGVKTRFVTPRTISELIPGSYSLLLNKTGYQDWSNTATVIAGKKTTLSAKLLK